MTGLCLRPGLVYMENAKLYGTDMCKKQKGVTGQLGWPATVAYLRNDYWVSYNMKVEWKEGMHCARRLHYGRPQLWPWD
ncbi:hypothetical protein LA080_006099 [Diaporthe eres]|nr:hypothetical protein LA080_006099 [Diaporthe eres]